MDQLLGAILLKPERFDVDPTCVDADARWKHWKQTFSNFLREIPNITETSKFPLLCNYVSSSVFLHINDCTTYDAAITVLDSIYGTNKFGVKYGGYIALGIFGGFIFLAVIIPIVLIIVRRNSNSQDSLDSLSTYESGGSREKLYQRQCWSGHPSSPHPILPHPTDERQNVKGIPEPLRDPMSSAQHQLRNHRHHHHHANTHRDSSEISLETSASTSRWCPKHEKRGGY